MVNKTQFYKTKAALAVILALGLSACISTSGESAYTVKPIELNSGKIICCDVEVSNTKDYEKLDMTFKISKEGDIEFKLIEDGVDASTPASVAAASNAKLADSVSALATKILDN